MGERLRTRPPLWPVVGLGLFIFFWAIASIYLALALALCVGILVLAHWAWTRLPEHFRHGSDRAEPAERDGRGRAGEPPRRRSR